MMRGTTQTLSNDIDLVAIPRLCTREHIAVFMGCSVAHVSKMVKDGIIPQPAVKSANSLWDFQDVKKSLGVINHAESQGS